MKIVLVNKYWYLKGGSERVVFVTKKLLEEAGHQVEVFGMKHEKNIFENEYFVENVDYQNMTGVQKIKNARNFIYNADAKTKFTKLLENFQPDVVHFHNIYHQLSFSLVEAARELHIPMVMTLHDYKMLSPNYTLFHHGKIDESCLTGKYYRCLLNNCMENRGESLLATLEAYHRKNKKYQEAISQYISPSYFLRDLCVRAGWSENSVQVIPNPLALEKNTFVSGEYVAYAGRLSSEKGVSILLEAAAQTPDISYKIAGTGPEEVSLKAQAQKLQLKNVEFVGWLVGDAMTVFLKNARLLVVPSLWYENYPYSILEAKVLGKIVLGANIGGIPEMIDADCLFDPKGVDSLVPLIKKWYHTPLAVRQERGEQLQTEVREINDRERYLDRVLDVYTKVCSV
jgi:glycosyltransferase involved in cell wall biosynthesis